MQDKQTLPVSLSRKKISTLRKKVGHFNNIKVPFPEQTIYQQKLGPIINLKQNEDIETDQNDISKSINQCLVSTKIRNVKFKNGLISEKKINSKRSTVSTMRKIVEKDTIFCDQHSSDWMINHNGSKLETKDAIFKNKTDLLNIQKRPNSSKSSRLFRKKNGVNQPTQNEERQTQIKSAYADRKKYINAKNFTRVSSSVGRPKNKNEKYDNKLDPEFLNLFAK